MHVPAAIGIVVIILVSFFAYRTFTPPSSPVTEPGTFNINQVESATPSASITASASVKMGVKASASPKTSIKPTSSPTAQSSTTTTSTSSNSSSNTTITTQTTSPTASSTPAPTPPSYTYSGNNLSVKVSCSHGESTFDLSFNGSVTTQSSGDGVWGVITGGSPSPLYFLYENGNYPNSVGVGGGYNDSVSSIRGQNNLTLSSAPGSFYEMKLYSAPFTSGTPSLDKQIGNAQFAADCQW